MSIAGLPAIRMSEYMEIGQFRIMIGLVTTLLSVVSCRTISPPPPQPALPDVLETQDAAVPATNAPLSVALPADYYLPYEPHEYVLQIGDQVDVSVFGNSDTAFTGIPVAPDGKLYYMFGAGIPAAGRKPQEVAADIEKNIGKVFNNPRVSILPQKFSGNHYLIYGKVNLPGIYDLETATTIIQAVARAGGVAQGIYRGTTVEIASLKDSYLTRNGKKLPLAFDRLILEHDTAQNIYLRPGDVINIASGLGKNSEVFLLGEVMEQRAVAYADGMTIVDLLAGTTLSGGSYTPNADLGKIAILRGSFEDPEVLNVDLRGILSGETRNIYLLPGDIIYLPSKPFTFAKDLAKTIVLTFVKTFTSSFASDLVRESLLPPRETGTDSVMENLDQQMDDAAAIRIIEADGQTTIKKDTTKRP